jgi:AcrR family transcriptional regulator
MQLFNTNVVRRKHRIPNLTGGEMLAEAVSLNVPDARTTRERIKRAARELFALNGVEAVTVRDIVRAAGGKNVSALNYYFGSKEELIETLIRDALAAANARWDRALTALEAAGGPKSIREVVEILVLRGLQPNAGEGDEASARFFATLLHTRRRLVTDTVAKLEFSAYDRALRHIRRLMPPMPDSAKDQRLLFYFWASSSIFAVLEGALDENRSYAEPWSAPDPLGNFIDAAVAMLEAPLTSPIEHIRKGSGARVGAETGRRA